MKKNTLIKFSLIALSCVLIALPAGCGQAENTSTPSASSAVNSSAPSAAVSTEAETSSSETNTTTSELYVRFGDGGTPFTMHLYDNDTAAAIARHVGTAEWRLPIYHYDDYDNWEVMQYYDIPSRYEIPSNPESITSEKAGTVYYSEPNRIVLFFGDAEVSGDYTQVGYFDVTEEFVSAVTDNPTVPGWSNKLVLISAGR